MENKSYLRVKTDILNDMSVTAGAGTGKTTALTSRYIHIITSGGDEGGLFKPTDITAVTFTRKASSEMKEKITREVIAGLDKCIKDGDDDRIRFYKDLRSELQSAHISTFHSLCTNILREYPHEAEVDPNFTLIDENMGTTLLEEVIADSILDDLSSESSGSAAATLIYSYGFSRTIDTIKALFFNPYLTEKVFKGYKPAAEDLNEDEKITRITTQSLNDFYFTVKERYNSSKAELGCLDFNDLETAAKKVLENSARIRRRYQNNIKFLMVDEFQDTNPVQKEIIYLLTSRYPKSQQKSGEKSPLLFIVGDPKQSIYRFRNADVEIFNRVKKDIGGENAAYLLKNFRSHKKLIDFINIFFDTYMSEINNDFETGYEPLLHTRDEEAEGEPKSRVKCIFFDDNALMQTNAEEPTVIPLKTAADDIVKPNAKERRGFEAKLIAKEIRRLVNSDTKVVYEDKNKLRAARYGDIMILFSALTSVELYTRELKKNGIPFTLSSGTAFYKKPWIYDLLNLLKAADNPYDDSALCGMLRSPFVLLKDSTLFAISLEKGGSFYEKLLSASKNDGMSEKLEKSEADKLLFSISMLKEMGLLKSRLKVSEFIKHFMDMTGYLLVLSSKSDGKIIIDNVKSFLNLADSTNIDGSFGTKKFIQYIELLQKLDAKQNTALNREGDDKVRIMSIHASKGLQSKIVIVPDISRGMSLVRSSVLLAEGYPPGIKIKRNEEAHLSESKAYSALKEIETQKKLAEHKRLLYVAATRAEDYLIFSGYIRFDKAASKKNIGIHTSKNWMDAFKSLFEIHSPADISRKDKTVGQHVEFITDNGRKKERVRCSIEFSGDFTIGDAKSNKESFVNEHRDNFKDFKQIGAGTVKKPAFLENVFKPIQKKQRYNYTVTMLNAFKKCKRLFYYKYIYGIPEYGFLPCPEKSGGKETSAGLGLDPAVKGNIVHKVLEDWSDYKNGYEPYLNKTIKEMNVIVSKEQKHELAKMLDNFAGSKIIERLKKSDDIKKEVTYITLINNRKIVSKLDCLYLYEGRRYVLDYKTEPVDDINAAFKKYRHQLEIYGLSAGLNLNIDSLKGEIYFLSPDELISFDIDIAAVKEEIKELIDEVESYSPDSFSGTVIRCGECERCGYSEICAGY
jgi:ATP-dependent helicase/nuclease subunit A